MVTDQRPAGAPPPSPAWLYLEQPGVGAARSQTCCSFCFSAEEDKLEHVDVGTLNLLSIGTSQSEFSEVVVTW